MRGRKASNLPGQTAAFFQQSDGSFKVGPGRGLYSKHIVVFSSALQWHCLRKSFFDQSLDLSQLFSLIWLSRVTISPPLTFFTMYLAYFPPPFFLDRHVCYTYYFGLSITCPPTPLDICPLTTLLLSSFSALLSSAFLSLCTPFSGVLWIFSPCRCVPARCTILDFFSAEFIVKSPALQGLKLLRAWFQLKRVYFLSLL